MTGRTIVTLVLLLCAMAGWAKDNESIALKDGDLPGFRLSSREVNRNEWPVVTRVPTELQSPESAECHAQPSTFTIDESKAEKKDGLHQQWVSRPVRASSGLGTVEPTIRADYVTYDKPEHARNAVWYYIARQRFPLIGIRPYGMREGPSALVKPIRVGDVGYLIKFTEQRFVFYARGNQAVLLDIDPYAWDDPGVQAYLKKLETPGS